MHDRDVLIEIYIYISARISKKIYPYIEKYIHTFNEETIATEIPKSTNISFHIMIFWMEHRQYWLNQKFEVTISLHLNAKD